MNRRLSDNYLELHQGQPENFFGIADVHYSPFDPYPLEKRVLNEFDQNFYLPDQDLNAVKKEEDQMQSEHYLQVPEQSPDSFQIPNLMDCLAITLKLPIEFIISMSHQNPLGFQKLIEKAKKILKRQKAKLRQQQKGVSDPSELEIKIEEQVEPEVSKKQKQSKVAGTSSGKKRQGKKKQEQKKAEESEQHTMSDKESIPSKSGNSEVTVDNEKQQKKITQMIRNRISAQNSRDRKKAYISQLEQNTNELHSKNTQLKHKLEELQKKEELYLKENSLLQGQIHQAKIDFLGQSKLNCFSCSSKELATHNGKPNFGKIGLTLLTLVSLFMMITGKNINDSQQALDVPSKETTSLFSLADVSLFSPLPNSDIPENYPSAADKITEKQILKQLQITQQQLRDYVSSEYELEFDEDNPFFKFQIKQEDII